MDESKKVEKIQELQAQAKYLRYLADVYLSISPRSNNKSIQTHSSYDDLPIKSSQKSFEELLEDQLQQYPSAFSSNIPQTLHQTAHKHSLTLNFRPSRLKVLQNRLKLNDSQKYQIFYLKINRLKEGFTIISKDIVAKEVKGIVKNHREATEDVRKVKDMRKTQRKREEIYRFRKVIEQLKEKEMKTEGKQKKEIERLKGEIEKLKKRLREIQRKVDKVEEISAHNYENRTPEKEKYIGKKVCRENINFRKKLANF